MLIHGQIDPWDYTANPETLQWERRVLSLVFLTTHHDCRLLAVLVMEITICLWCRRACTQVVGSNTPGGPGLALVPLPRFFSALPVIPLRPWIEKNSWLPSAEAAHGQNP